MSLQLAEEIIKGRRLKRGEDLSFLLSEDLDELCAGADKIRKELCGNHVDLCSIINGRSGRCGEDCKFCAQSACHHTKVEEYPFLEPEEILEDCKRHEAKKVHRYSIVTAGRALTGAEMEKALRAYRAMKKECKVELCASHGLLSQEDFNRLKEAGVGRYHANIETSRRNFPNICTTHTFGGHPACAGGGTFRLFRRYHRHGRNLGRPDRHGDHAERARDQVNSDQYPASDSGHAAGTSGSAFGE